MWLQCLCLNYFSYHLCVLLILDSRIAEPTLRSWTVDSSAVLKFCLTRETKMYR